MAGEDDKQPSFTEEQSASIKQLVVGMVNSALRSHLALADKKRAEDREAVKSDFAKLLDEKLQSLKPKEEEPPANAKDGGKRQALELELNTVKRTTSELQQKIQDAEAKAAAAATKLKASERKERLARVLAPLGLEGARFHAAYPHLVEHVRAQSDEEDAPDMWVDESGETELEAGAKAWAKTDFAKLFLPPTKAGGSGSRGIPTMGGRNENKDKTTYEDVGNAVLALTAPMGGLGRLGE